MLATALHIRGDIWVGRELALRGLFQAWARAKAPFVLGWYLDSKTIAIRATAVGDRAAFRELYVHFVPLIKASCRRRGLRWESAEEVAQETMVLVWQKAALFNEEKGTVTAWIFAISRNKAVDHLRSDRPHVPLEAADEPVCMALTPEENCLRQDGNRYAMSLYAKLPIGQQNALQWSVLAEETHSSAAKINCVPLGTLKTNVRNGLLKLRQLAMSHGEFIRPKRANVSCAAAE